MKEEEEIVFSFPLKNLASFRLASKSVLLRQHLRSTDCASSTSVGAEAAAAAAVLTLNFWQMINKIL